VPGASSVISPAARRAGVALAALVLVVLSVLASTGQARATKATVHVVRLKPLTVTISGLKPGESVVAKLTGAATATVKGTATAAGSVKLTFPKAAFTACSAYSLRATGAKGSVATLKSTVGAACKPKATVDFGASVVVVGSNFQPAEHLTVTLIADGTRKRTAVASAKGLLHLSFGALPLSNCSAYTLKITGSKGSTFKKVQPALPC
jgi:hypothetical protein